MNAGGDRSEWDAFIAEEAARANVLELTIQHPPKESEHSKLEEKFESQIRDRRLPQFVKQFPFAKQVGRQWKFDYAFGWPNPWRIAVEIEGLVMRRDKQGNWQIGGRHGTIGGFEEDCIKYNTAALLGWTVLRFTGSQVRAKSGFAIAMTQRVLYSRGWRPTPKTKEEPT